MKEEQQIEKSPYKWKALKSLIEWLLLGALLHGLSEASNQVKYCNLVCCLVPEK